MEVIGYKYNSEEKAIEARKQCADFYNLPINSIDITKYWVNYKKADLNTPVFWYIQFVETVEETLGAPETFEVTFAHEAS